LTISLAPLKLVDFSSLNIPPLRVLQDSSFGMPESLQNGLAYIHVLFRSLCVLVVDSGYWSENLRPW
jgi:hypothetical protein